MPESSTPTDFLRYEEASEEFNIPINTLYAKVSRREIPHYRLGGRCVRFSRKELLAHLRDHHVDCQTDNESKK